jgi:amino acid transporter
VPQRLRHLIFGAPKDVKDPHAFHKLSLIALLAWVGLGADGLSSSAYGPEEAYRQLGEHTGLAVFLALAMAATVFIISYGYSRIIERFPSGGGGYVVATQLLGKRVGVVSGSALLVDYVLTITISIASGADAIFSFLPTSWQEVHLVGIPLKMLTALGGLGLLTVMNLRGVKESVKTLVPIFMIFLVTHALAILLAIGGHLDNVAQVTTEVTTNVRSSFATLTGFGALSLLVRAYSLGGGTYTGIEAVSNGVGLMREPRVPTAKRTMVLMAGSLAFTAAGILLAYLFVHAAPVEGKTMNAVMLERIAGDWHIGSWPVGSWFVITALFSEGALLFVAAQAGFVDGPRVMANMATDSWLPHRFAALSERLSMRNGVLLMAGSSLAALVYTQGSVGKLVVMYSINVFVTFSLSNLAMVLYWVKHRKDHEDWWRHVPAHLLALVLCATILVVMVLEKFTEGAWLTLVITSALVAVCFLIKRHYNLVGQAIHRLDKELPSPDEIPGAVLETNGYDALPGSPLGQKPVNGEPDPSQPLAVLFVGGYGGLGRHALLTLLRMFPGHFKGVAFVSVAVVDSDVFKGADQVRALEERTQQHLARYEKFGRALGLKATSAYAVGTEVAVEAEKLGTELCAKYPKALVVAGQLIFQEDTLFSRVLHNETAFLIQQRLQHIGVPMIVIPVRLNLRERRPERPLSLREPATPSTLRVEPPESRIAG